MNRYDFVYIFDVTDGNPNGDPDAGNLPRVDAETGQGLITDVCLKRKIRNYVGIVHGEQPPHEIYIKERAVLNAQHDRAWQKVDPNAKAKEKDKLPKDLRKARALTRFMCDNFFDIRTFGAVMTTKVNCGQVRGPVQFGFARSIDPVVSLEHAITRCAVTRQEDFDAEGKDRDMGRKFTVPYGLYRVHGFINPFLADGDNGTGFGDKDLDLLKSALNGMFEYDRSAARGEMAPRACIAFKHDSPLGNARADQLFSRVRCARRDGAPEPPRSFDDYVVTVDEADLPEGVAVQRWV
jgi:CRISPR-associated protein Csd2